jgi:flagellar hook protein FlgE
MDVIGDNIANVNTVGFKASRVNFRDGFAQVLQAATQAQDARGGRNPAQVGSGVTLGSINADFTQGSLEATGRAFDLAIEGSGFFVLGDGAQNYYSRAGDFQLDGSGRLVQAGTGLVVQGVGADSQGLLTGSVGDLILPLGEAAAPVATSQIRLSGNLDAGAEAGAVRTMTATVYDSAGLTYEIALTFTSTGNGSWDWNATGAGGSLMPPTEGGIATFDGDGALTEFTYPDGGSGLTVTRPGGGTFSIEVVSGDAQGRNGLTGFASTSTAAVLGQNGYGSGELTDVGIDANGIITGLYSNGTDRVLGQVALATFTNPSGLTRSGGSLYLASSNSGTAAIGFAGDGGASTLTSGALESSNVDISQELTDMIITQRGFQASAQVITTSDELLAEVINLLR